MDGRDRPDSAVADPRGITLERLIFDTSVLVSAERSGGHLDELASDDDDVVIAAVTAAELLVGVELADVRRKPARRGFVEAILAQIPIETYDLAPPERTSFSWRQLTRRVVREALTT